MAADQGIAYAQAELGAAYDLGQSVPKDHAQALMWFRKAAEQGYGCDQTLQKGIVSLLKLGSPRLA
jgi:TPR repeat protein